MRRGRWRQSIAWERVDSLKGDFLSGTSFSGTGRIISAQSQFAPDRTGRHRVSLGMLAAVLHGKR
jgi:hypothetical protein